MGHEPLTKWVVLIVTLIQFGTAFYLRKTPFFSLKFWILAYIIGGTANQNTFLAVHEITHNLAFRGVRPNRLFAIFANLPIGVPFAMMFKRYHIEHHKVSTCYSLSSVEEERSSSWLLSSKISFWVKTVSTQIFLRDSSSSCSETYSAKLSGISLSLLREYCIWANQVDTG